MLYLLLNELNYKYVFQFSLPADIQTTLVEFGVFINPNPVTDIVTEVKI